MQITFLWWEGCPSHPEAWQRLQRVLEDHHIEAEVLRREIKTDVEADDWHFPGSPTIQINGEDIDPNASNLPARLTCRLYLKEDGRPSPVPSRQMIERAVLAALEGEKKSR